jgi:hypothetical protein
VVYVNKMLINNALGVVSDCGDRLYRNTTPPYSGRVHLLRKYPKNNNKIITDLYNNSYK